MSHLRPPRPRPVRLSPLERIALGFAVALAWALMPFYHGLAWLSSRWERARGRAAGPARHTAAAKPAAASHAAPRGRPRDGSSHDRARPSPTTNEKETP